MSDHAVPWVSATLEVPSPQLFAAAQLWGTVTSARLGTAVNQVVDRIVLRDETAEVLRHQAWGARRMGSGPGWTVLRYRAGMPYGVTGRAPGDV
ncbi:MAG: hypothetical protein ABI776_09915 [Nocardioidaceae bacterium]